MRDPLWRDVEAGHVISRAVLGTPVRFETNSPEILAAVAETFRDWPTPPANSGRGARVQLTLHEGEPESGSGCPEPWYRMPSRERLLLCAGQSVAVAEIDRAVAYGYVTRDLLERDLEFRIGFIEAMTLALVTHVDRYPLHAATVCRDADGLLLIGRSGAGKSSMAYAAHRAGLTVRGEDVAYVQLQPGFCVWSKPGSHRLFPDIAARFPELKALAPTRLSNGKHKVLVPVSPTPTEPLQRVALVFLSKSGHDPVLERLAPEAVARILQNDPETGFDLDGQPNTPVVQALAARPGWRLQLSPDPRDAMEHLERVLDDLSGELSKDGT